MALIAPNVAQTDALAYLSQSRHLRRGIVVLPTGAGKTIMAALDTVQAGAERILFLVHREEILKQAKKEFNRVRGDDPDKYGYVIGNRKDFDAEIILSTVQTASRPKNLDKLTKIPFDYVIVDECHHANAPSYLRVLEALDAKFILGLTATDFRGDGKKVPAVFGDNVIYRMALKEAIERKLVVPVLYYGLYDNIDYSKIKFGPYGYRENDLNKTLIIDERDRAIIERFKEKCGARQAIGFCASVKHVHSMVDKFNKAGISAVGVTYGMDKASRKKRFDDFAAGKYRVLFAKDILNEGVDFPNVGAVLFLRPTYSKTVFMQQLGRGLRKAEGKENVIALDFIGNSEKADLVREAMKAECLLETPVEPKPELKYDVSQVYFEERVIDILNSLEKNQLPSASEIIAKIKQTADILGKIPECKELEKHTGITKYMVKQVFDSYTNGVNASGICATKAERLADIRNVAEKLGHAPSLTEYRKLGRYASANFNPYYFSDSWPALVREAGLKPHYQTTGRGEILAKAREFFKGKETIPTKSEFCKFAGISPTTLIRYIESYENLLALIGRSYKREFVSDSEILADIRRCFDPSDPDKKSTTYKKIGKYQLQTVVRHFGSWCNAVEAAYRI